MSRCIICDHMPGYANEYLHAPATGKRVRLRHHQHGNMKNSEYYCDPCWQTIGLALDDHYEGAFGIQVSEAPPTVSLREVK